MSEPQPTTWTVVAAQLAGWLAALGAAAVALTQAAKWLVRALRSGAAQRRSAASVEALLRDGLWKEIERQGRAIDELRGKFTECEARADECAAENRQLREHAEAREQRISQLEDKVQRLEEGACPVARCERTRA